MHLLNATSSERNWAGNYTYGARKLHRPTSVDQVQEIVAKAEKVRVLGSRHSFNDIADTTGDHVSLDHFDRVLDVGPSTVTVEPTIKYGTLATYLHARGVGQKPGGWRNARYNLEMGPPLLAPLLLTMVGAAGLLGAVLRRSRG